MPILATTAHIVSIAKPKRLRRKPLTRTQNSVLRDLLDYRDGNRTCRSHGQTSLDTAMREKPICHYAIRSLEDKGYIHRLSKDREVLHCEFPQEVIDQFAPKPLDPEYYKILCLYIRSLGKRLTPAMNSVARAIAERVCGPQHNATVGIDSIAVRVGMSHGGTGDQIRALRSCGILGLIGSSYHGGHHTNTYRFRGVRPFLDSLTTAAKAEVDAPTRPITWTPFAIGKERFFDFLRELPAEEDQARLAGRHDITKKLGISGWSIDRYSRALHKEGRLTWSVPDPPRGFSGSKAMTRWYLHVLADSGHQNGAQTPAQTAPTTGRPGRKKLGTPSRPELILAILFKRCPPREVERLLSPDGAEDYYKTLTQAGVTSYKMERNRVRKLFEAKKKR